jgi:hypothetical protein
MTLRFGLDVPPHERRPVAWYAPAVLWQAARKLLAAEQFATHLDRRETFAGDLQPADFRTDAGDFWFDFVSDTGDGGDATFAVAQGLFAKDMAGTQAVDEAGKPLPQGRLLLLGGDLAYPGSGRLDYQYRFIEPFEQARDWARLQGGDCWALGGEQDCRGEPLAPQDKVLLAIPQNHDWAVSCSTFCRYFVNTDAGAVVGARTPQRQTWFAARLPHDWWVLGLDFALDGDLDRTQYDSFAALRAQGLGPGSQLVLVYPEPYWTRPLGDHAPEGYPKRYQRLEKLLQDAGAEIRLRLAGDLHHVAHEVLQRPGEPDTHLLVAGHGGAFTHATHTVETERSKRLRERTTHVEVGLSDAAELPAFAHGVRYPQAAASRAWALQAWRGLFGFRSSGKGFDWQEQWDSNRGLLPLFGLLIGLLTWFGWGIQPQVDFRGFPSPTVALPALAMAAVCAAALWEPLAPRLAVGIGLLHALAQLGSAWLWTLICFGPAAPLGAAYGYLGWPLFVLASGLSAGLLLGVFLAWACAAFGLCSNAASGVIASEQHKGFVRFRLDAEGALTAFVLGLDAVPARSSLPGADDGLPKHWRVVERIRIAKT